MSAQHTSAIQITETGGPEVMVPTELPLAAPGPGEVAVQLAAAGVNFKDIYERTGVYKVALPFVVGSEGAGTVVALGDGVSDIQVGQRVAWPAIAGSYAAMLNAPAAQLIPVPDGVSDEQAAAIPLQGLTSHYLATESYRIAEGDTVLIHAGAGGVGLLLTQIAKILGATVITTVSDEHKATLSRHAGADQVLVGYGDFPTAAKDLTDGQGVAAVYDGVGKDTFDGSLAALRRRGTMVLFGGASGQVPPFDLQRLNAGGSLTITRPSLKDFIVTRDELLARSQDLFGWVAEGRLTVRIGGTYPLRDAAKAHEDLAARRTTGKLLLLP